MSQKSDKLKNRIEIQPHCKDDNFDLITATTTTTFAQRLKLVIGSCSMTAFAQRCKLSESAIRKYIRGNSEPTLQNLLIMAKVGNVPLTWLATGKTDHPASLKHHANEITTLPPFVINHDNIIIHEVDFNSLLQEKIQFIAHSQWTLSKKWLHKEGLQNANLAFTALNCENSWQTTKYGDIALINIKTDGWRGAIEGIFIISLNDSLFIKRIQFDPIKNGYHLCSDHTAYYDHFIELNHLINFKIIARIERILMRIL